MDLGVVQVANEALPKEQEWALIYTDEAIYFVVKRGRVTPQVLAEMWGAYRRMRRQHHRAGIPEPRGSGENCTGSAKPLTPTRPLA